MDPKELLRQLEHNASPMRETDSFGRKNAKPDEILRAILKSHAPQLSKKQLRQEAREERRGRGPERS